jgi:hypothetical protein
MKKQILNILMAAVCIPGSITAQQCGSPAALGSAFNMLTNGRNMCNPVAVDKNLNTVIFLHRHNSNVFGGNSGNLRYDVSTTGGTSWTTNLGVLNPVSTYVARYPNAVIYNPSGNTNVSGAYLGYTAATFNSGSGAWNGIVTGVRQLSGSGNTEFYNQPGASSYFINGSLVKGAPGVFWALDLTSNGINPTGGINVFKGTWNGSNINWTTNTVLTPNFDVSALGYPIVGELNIAFDPTGTIGWIAVMTDLTSGPSTYGYYPVFYKTVNGGVSWTGPVSFNFSQFDCITSNISGSAFPAAHYMADLAVDIKGNPHLLTTVGDGLGNYSVDFTSWHHVFDITQVNGMWTAYDVANVNAANAIFNGSSGSALEQSIHPHVARTADGKKIFFSWSDNANYFLGSNNYSPDFFARGLDVQISKWTPVTDFSSCNFAASGRVLFPHLAEEVLEPNANTYKLAPVYGEMSSSDPDLPSNFKFLDNVIFTSGDFVINSPNVNVNITQGNTVAICPGNSINLTLGGIYSQVIWSNGSTNANNLVNLPGLYYVTARSGCLIGSDTISVQTLSLSASSLNNIVCVGTPVTLSVTGNASGYTWAPGPVQGQSVSVNPVSSIIYTVTGTANGNCNLTSTVSLIVNPAPTITAVSSRPQLCVGEPAVLMATGGSAYSWNTGVTNPSISISPTVTTSYTVTGVNSAGCSASYTITQVVDPCVGLNSSAVPSQITVYPNPASGEFWIRSAQEITLQLFNAIGQQVNTFAINDRCGYRVSVSQLPAGIYYLSGISDNKKIHLKLIVE